MVMAYVAKKGFDTIRRNKNAERMDRDARKTHRFVGGSAIAAVGLLGAGLWGGVGNGEKNVTDEITGGQATIEYLDRTFKSASVIAFKTRVDGVEGKRTTEQDKALGFISVPDDWVSVGFDNYVVDSSLCFEGGAKKVRRDIAKKSLEVTIAWDEVAVCSKHDPTNSPQPKYNGGNAYLNKVASNAIQQGIKNFTGWDLNDPSVIDELNKQTEDVRQLAENTAMRMVDEKCGPIVAEETKDDIEKLIASDYLLEYGETITVTLQASPDGSVKLKDEPQKAQYFESLKDGVRDSENHLMTYSQSVQSIGTCTLPDKFKQLQGQN